MRIVRIDVSISAGRPCCGYAVVACWGLGSSGKFGRHRHAQSLETFVREFPTAELAHFTQIDYDGEMALIAVARGACGAEEMGVVRACAEPDNITAEFAILARSDLKGQGLGRLLMQKLLRYCREHGTQQLWGNVLTTNTAMLHLSHSLGFTVCSIDRDVEEIALDLQPGQAAVASQ